MPRRSLSSANRGYDKCHDDSFPGEYKGYDTYHNSLSSVYCDCDKCHDSFPSAYKGYGTYHNSLSSVYWDCDKGHCDVMLNEMTESHFSISN